MSFRLTQWAWHQPVGSNTKLVLLALADFADDAGICFPSQRTLARKCGLARSTINLHLQQLVQQQLLVIEHQTNRLGQNISSRYHLSLKGDPNVSQPQSDSQTPCGPTSRQPIDITYHLTHQQEPKGPKSGLGRKPALKDAL